MTKHDTVTNGTTGNQRVTGAINVMRATADEVGDRLPAVVDTVREGATEGARTIQEMPDRDQRLLAAFSLGLGLGLSIAGAPRLLAIATLAPALLIGTQMATRRTGAS